VDFSRDAAMGRRWGWLLVLADAGRRCLGPSAHAGMCSASCMPLHDLAAQTRAMSPGGCTNA
jgi:hypothetical protein